MEVHVLEIKFPFGGEEQPIYPVILQGNTDTVLVDCGYEEFLPLIGEAAGGKGISIRQLPGIIITQHDIDHMGGLFEMKSAFPLLTIYSSELEKNISAVRKSRCDWYRPKRSIRCYPKSNGQAPFVFSNY